MSKENEMESVSELRERVRREMISDAVEVNRKKGVTEIYLYYHEPETESHLVKTPFGLAIAVREPEGEKMMAEVLDDISSITSPDRMDVEDKNGYYVVQLTYEDGRTW